MNATGKAAAKASMGATIPWELGAAEYSRCAGARPPYRTVGGGKRKKPTPITPVAERALTGLRRNHLCASPSHAGYTRLCRLSGFKSLPTRRQLSILCQLAQYKTTYNTLCGNPHKRASVEGRILAIP